MKTRQLKILGYVAFVGALIVAFQNCGKVQFSPAPSASNATGNLTPPAPVPIVCPVGSSVVNGGCQVCQNFTQLPSNSAAYVIPADGNCYSIHIINSVANQSSSNWQVNVPYINSRLHGVPTNQNAPPGIIGTTKNSDGSINTGAIWNGNITLNAHRTVTFAGNPTGTGSASSITVDNYLLLLTQSNALGLNIFGEGSKDAVPWVTQGPGDPNAPTGPIIVNGQPINYYPFASGGTSNITPSDLSSFFPVGNQVTFSAMGLDCGSVGGISDIYLLFQ